MCSEYQNEKRLCFDVETVPEKPISAIGLPARIGKKLGVENRSFSQAGLKKKTCGNLSASDLFVLPSLSEGMPNALLEALGLNLACMGSWIRY